MEVTFKARHTNVPDRFRKHATAKLAKIERLDQNAMRIDVQVSTERNPRQADRSERVELTIRSRGPAIRAEAAADDRYVALDLAFAKLESRLRRMGDRRKPRRADLSVRSPEVLAAVASPAAARAGAATVSATAVTSPRAAPSAVPPSTVPPPPVPPSRPAQTATLPVPDATSDGSAVAEGLVPIDMEGDGPLIVREKAHLASPMTIDQALLEMELVGHDFYLFHDSDCGRFSVVYRRRGYDYGVIRLVEQLSAFLSAGRPAACPRRRTDGHAC